MFKVLIVKQLHLIICENFECTEIAETIYEGVVDPSFQTKPISAYVNHSGIISKVRVGSAPSKFYSMIISHA